MKQAWRTIESETPTLGRCSVLEPDELLIGPEQVSSVGTAPEVTPVTAPDKLSETPLERRVREFLERTEPRPVVTIRNMAAAFRLSRSHLQKTFKLQTGVCMGQWITEYKLQRAASLLENSNLSVKEIAYTIGYEHSSSFIRAFERRFTEAPTGYRKLNDCKRTAHR
jgi:AraC-like DNA-binding protein